MTDLLQIILNINTLAIPTFKNYYANIRDKALVSELYKTARGRGERFIFFCGSKGVGCTHLLKASCNTSEKLGLTNFYLALENIDKLKPNIFDNLETFNLVCIDDIQNIACKKKWEESFFYLFNRMESAGKRLLVTSNTPLRHIKFKLPDLISRLKSGLMFQAHPLSDNAKIEVMTRYTKKKGVKLKKSVAVFLLNHWQRDMGSLFTALKKLDKASLKAKHKLTIPFLKKS